MVFLEILITKQLINQESIMTKSEPIKTRIGNLKFTHDFPDGYPTRKTVEKLFNELDFQRACQAYLWGLPIVCFAEWQHVHEEQFEAKSGDIVVYKTYQDKLGLLTANATTPYALSFIRLNEEGPIVIEMPQGEVRGAAHSMWQVGITSMTTPGKYVFVAPGEELFDTTEEYNVSQSPTNSIFLGLRLMSSDKDVCKELLENIKIYPYSKRDQQQETKIIYLEGQPWQGYQPRGIAYFERLAHILLHEPVAERDRFFMAMLKPLGIEKGKKFHPTKEQKDLLEEAAFVGEAMAQANDFDKSRLEAAEYVEGSHWEVATVCPPDQRYEYYESLDGRAAWFYEAVTNDPAMQAPIDEDVDVTAENYVYDGQIYLGSYVDSEGEWLDGGKNYRLHVLPDAPADEFWSITIYDVATRCLIDNEQKIGDKSSRMDLHVNKKDGSIDIYIGPKAPKEEEKKNNWIPTVPGKSWFAYFRFYSPKKEYFDRSWILPNIEQVREVKSNKSPNLISWFLNIFPIFG